MNQKDYTYIIAGAGLTATSACKGIRDVDKSGSILIIGNESYKPYHRPPLTKGLWTGKKKVGDIFVDDSSFYAKNGIDLLTGVAVKSIDKEHNSVVTDSNETCHYEKLLIATGGTPKQLTIPGGDLHGLIYFRYLDDYLQMRSEAGENKSVLVIGGGFIGSELAASLTIAEYDTTMLFPDPYISSRIFPTSLAAALQKKYHDKGIGFIYDSRPVVISKRNNRFIVLTSRGTELETDLIVVGIGINPNSQLAQEADILTANGVIVNEFLESSYPGIFAAGDVANFPQTVLGNEHIRIEHWDNAINQGLYAGRAMAGKKEPYNYIPYFFSDLFDFGYEAIGEVNSQLPTIADWQKENETGVIYYLRENILAGILLCNVWGKIDLAREMLLNRKKIAINDLQGAIQLN